ncbi:MAG TPA: ABC transporter substrate-binding protein [Stellaceae bacterium]|nr:ABC transporter substrate-binding protein [Stellaceae bacterium]
MPQAKFGTAAVSRRAVMGGVAAGVAASYVGRAKAAGKRGGVLRVAADFQPTNLDPVAGSQGGDLRFLYPIYQSLVDWEPDTLKPKPGLATSWTFTDPKTLVLELRQNVLFHDGTAFDAAAVKFNLERTRTDPKSNIKNDLASVAAIEATGSHQITLRLNKVNAALPSVLAERGGLMASPAAIEKSGADFARNPVGTGPWKFGLWRDNDIYTVTRNEKYWKPDEPYLDAIEFRIIADNNIGLRSVMAGENDVVLALSSAQKPVVERATNLNSSFGTSQAGIPIWLNYARPPLNDVRVRQAINYAVDRDAFNKVTALGLNEVARGLLPSTHWAYDPSLEATYPHDPAKAKELLAAAGLAAGFDMSLIGPTDERSRQRQEVVIEQLKQVGIRVKLSGFSVNDAIKTFFVDKQGDALLIQWGGRPDPTMTFRDLFSKESFYNPARTEPDGFADALAETEASEDFAVRAKALSKVQHIVSDNALMVPLIFDAQYTAFATKVKNWRTNLFGRPRFDDVYLEG